MAGIVNNGHRGDIQIPIGITIVRQHIHRDIQVFIRLSNIILGNRTLVG